MPVFYGLAPSNRTHSIPVARRPRSLEINTGGLNPDAVSPISSSRLSSRVKRSCIFDGAGPAGRVHASRGAAVSEWCALRPQWVCFCWGPYTSEFCQQNECRLHLGSAIQGAAQMWHWRIEVGSRCPDEETEPPDNQTEWTLGNTLFLL